MPASDRSATALADAPTRGIPRPTILCIDDDPDVTNAISMILSAYDVDVIRDCCGAQGIWDAINRKPDLIITDLRMPQGDGEDLLACIRGNGRTRHIPVIVLTGRPGSHLPGELRKRGADGFLRKPALFKTLLDEVKQFIPLCQRE